MKSIIRKYLAACLAIFVVSELKTGLIIEKGWHNLAAAALFLSLILLLKPLLDALMLPLNLLTLNLTNHLAFIAVIYIWGLLAWQTTYISINITEGKFGPFSFSSLRLSSFEAGILSSILMVVILKLSNWLFK